MDGNQLIDLGSGIAVTTVGASNPAVAKAVAEQAARFTHTCFIVAPSENYIELAEKLATITPGHFEKRAVFFNSGAEAVENAIKVARVATGRQAVVAFRPCLPRPYKPHHGLDRQGRPLQAWLRPAGS